MEACGPTRLLRVINRHSSKDPNNNYSKACDSRVNFYASSAWNVIQYQHLHFSSPAFSSASQKPVKDCDLAAENAGSSSASNLKMNTEGKAALQKSLLQRQLKKRGNLKNRVKSQAIDTPIRFFRNGISTKRHQSGSKGSTVDMLLVT
ncbi:hypothetical protein ACU8KH_00196 [Lachancea thermotolerans]